MGRLPAVENVQIVGPGLRPIFPGMRSRVERDVGVLVVGFGVLVVGSEGFGVVEPLVAKNLAKRGPTGLVGEEQRPVIMANLVAKVSEQSAVVFTESVANFGPLCGVRLVQVERDEPIVVARDHGSLRCTSTQGESHPSFVFAL